MNDDDVFGVQIFLAMVMAIQIFFVLDWHDNNHHFLNDDDDDVLNDYNDLIIVVNDDLVWHEYFLDKQILATTKHDSNDLKLILANQDKKHEQSIKKRTFFKKYLTLMALKEHNVW